MKLIKFVGENNPTMKIYSIVCNFDSTQQAEQYMGPFVTAFFKIDFRSVLCFCYNFFNKRKASNKKSV